VLTTSSTGFIGFFISGILIMLNHAKISNILGASVLFFALGSLLYNNSPEFRKRVDSGLGLWLDEDFSVENVNSSSFVLYNNYHIALENFKSNPIAGSGLGSHAVAFEKYSLTKQAGVLNIQFNKSDANSMFLRLMSETGIIGVIFILIFIFKFHVTRNKKLDDSQHWIISSALLVIIILYLFRQGNYFINGFPLFMWMYYYNYANYKTKYKKSIEPEVLNPKLANA
jgi:O-antigen ligase